MKLKCNVCNSFIKKTHTYKEIPIYTCSKCGFGQIDYSMTPEMKKYGDETTILVKPSKNLMMRALYVSSFISEGRVIDLGSNFARFYKALQCEGLDKNYKVVSVDTNPKIIELSNGLVTLCDITSEDLITKFGEKSFDVVVSSHTIEHVPYPKEALTLWKRLMKDEGMMFIETPDVNMKKKIETWLDPSHISFFTMRSMKKLLDKVGLEIINSFEAPKGTKWIPTFGMMVRKK